MPGIPQIVIAGGGFAGLNAALAAVRAADGQCAVTLVSRDPWLTIRPRLYEKEPEQLRADLLAPLQTVGASFLEGEITAVDDKSLVLASGATVPFDRLVVATGSVMRMPDIPGADTAFTVDDYNSAVRFDAHLRTLKGVDAPRVAVIGAGFTGIELALEMRDRIAVHAGPDAAEQAEIHLYDREEHVGADLGPGPRPAIEAALKAARVTVMLSETVEEIGPDAVRNKGGQPQRYDAVILCTGLRAAPFVDALEAPKDTAGRLICGPHLEVPSLPGLFAAGDAGCAALGEGKQTLFSCQHARMLGLFAGENAARDALGQPLIPYAQPRYVTCLALGRSGAVFTEGWERTPKITGEDAAAIKMRINRELIYPPTGDRQAVLDASRIPD